MMKRIHSLTVAAAILGLLVTGCTYEGDTIINKVEPEHKTFDIVTEELTSKEVNVVGADTPTKITLGFRAGKEDIPYVSLTPALLKEYLSRNFTVSEINADTKQITITNEDRSDSKSVLDLTTHMLSFENYDLFFSNSDKVYMDPTDSEEFAKREDDGKTYLVIIDENTSNVAGQEIALDWSTQDIGVVLWKKTDGTYELAVPLQFFNDVFLSSIGSHLVYNGKDVFTSGNIAASLDTYYASPYASTARSEALAEFCYNELCLNLDFNYGLKEIHGIDKFPDFDTYFKSAGIDDDLTNTDTSIFANALKDVCEFYFGDGHSNYMYNSPYIGRTPRPTGNHTSAQGVKYTAETTKYQTARDSVYNGDLPGLDISTSAGKKTAIVRFDEFTLGNILKRADRKTKGDELLADDNALLKKYVNYSDEGKTVHTYESEYDTVTFIYAVNEAIKKYDEDNPGAEIENIVLDMSCNGGGANHSAGFLLAWLLGQCDFAFTNPLSGAKWTVSYLADVDMNGTAGEARDTVKDKNLFCLVSPVSFSCGNMVPAMLKASDRVTILGVTSSGGSSCVQMSSAADGTTFRMSSKWVMSVQKNGSNYDIDKGVEPDVRISIPEKFYDINTIDTLVKKINSGTFTN